MLVSPARLCAAALAIIALAISATQLERWRDGLVIDRVTIGTTPATVYRKVGAPAAPVVVIAHGFAGSRQLMEAFSLTLAQSGYVAVAFDFEGHGRNPVSMSGDVTSVEGTTRLLMAEIGRVTDWALAEPYADGRVALLGHSMASDIVVRQAIADPRVTATLAISMFSEAVSETEPRNLLVVAGAWEGFLRDEALRAVHLVDARATEQQTVGSFADGTARRAVAAPSVEHVGVLYSATTLREVRDWLDQLYARPSDGAPVAAIGGWIVMGLAAIVLLAWPLAALLPKPEHVREHKQTPVPRGALLAAVSIPTVATPLILSLFETRLLPVLVADYLAVHLALYGILVLAVLAWFGVRLRSGGLFAGLALAAYGIFVFGGFLDRYAVSFVPHAGRLPIIAAIAFGAVATMTADAMLSDAGRAPLWRTLAARAAFLISLMIAVALDFERLFFLLMILPIVIIFYLIFGLMGGWVGRRTGAPLAAGVGMGLTLAWAIGVSFPLFAVG